MRLFRLELKRILKTRLVIILLLFAVFLAFFMAYVPTTFSYVTYTDENGEFVELTGLEAIKYKKELQADIEGYVTTEKVREALKEYQRVLRKYDVRETYDLPKGVYAMEILPYSPLLHGIKEVFANSNTGVAPSLMDINSEKIDDYYSYCNDRIKSLMKLEQKEYPVAQQVAVNMYSKVAKPYQFFSEYPTDAMDYQILLAFLIMCICAVIVAPIFTSDYQTGADDILRCTKYGRMKFAVIKILSAILISGTVFTLCASIYIILSNSLFGWESTKTSMQMMFSIVNLLNMNIGELQWFCVFGGLLAILATMSFILYVSSKCRNVVVSLSIALVFCILPFIIYMALPSGMGKWIYSIIPSSGTGLQTSILYSAVDFEFLNIGNISLWLPFAMIGVCMIEIPVFISLTVNSYMKHKVN